MKAAFVILTSLFVASFATACASGSEDGSEDVGMVELEARGGKNQCALKCAAPPEGCHYEDAVLSGPCHKLTCGTLVCDGSTT